MLKKFQIGIEGDKCELLDFINDFEFRKISLSVTDDQAIFMIATHLDPNTRYILERIQCNSMN